MRVLTGTVRVFLLYSTAGMRCLATHHHWKTRHCVLFIILQRSFSLLGILNYLISFDLYFILTMGSIEYSPPSTSTMAPQLAFLGLGNMGQVRKSAEVRLAEGTSLICVMSRPCPKTWFKRENWRSHSFSTTVQPAARSLCRPGLATQPSPLLSKKPLLPPTSSSLASRTKLPSMKHSKRF